jgi:hypothetical protein
MLDEHHWTGAYPFGLRLSSFECHTLAARTGRERRAGSVRRNVETLRRLWFPVRLATCFAPFVEVRPAWNASGDLLDVGYHLACVAYYAAMDREISSLHARLSWEGSKA